jgi:hypothetical protein
MKNRQGSFKLSKIYSILRFENFLSFLMAIAVLGLSFPYGFPLFSILIFLYFFYSLITKQILIKINYYIILIFLCIIIYFTSILYNGGFIYVNNINDIKNILNILILLLLLGNLDEKVYKIFLNNFLFLMSIFMPIVSLVSLYKYFLLLSGKKIGLVNIVDNNYPWGSSLMSDYNMFSLGLIVGLVGVISIFKYSSSLIYKTYCLFGSVSIITSIFLSGSRRGIVVLIILLLALLLTTIYKILRLKRFPYKASISILIVILLTTYLVTSFNIKIINEYEFYRLLDRYQTLNNVEEGFSSRTSLWQSSYELLSESTITNIFFGNGFNYLESLANKLAVEGEVYPHNPILSSMLYSGVLGSLFIFLLLLFPIYKLLRFWTSYTIEMLIIYFTIFVFLIISQNSVFSTDIFWLLMLVIGSINFKCSNSLKDTKDLNELKGDSSNLKGRKMKML